mgnify:CR=1 FL=1
MFDLSNLAASLETKHEVVHPTKGATGWVITLAGDEHPATKDAVRKMLDRRARHKTSSREQDEQDGLELLCARVLGWEGATEEYSPEKAREVFAREGLAWLRRRLLEVMGDEAGFFEK